MLILSSKWFSKDSDQARPLSRLPATKLVGPFVVWDDRTFVVLITRHVILLTNLVGSVSDTVIEFQGLTVVQVSQNQAAVVSDPQNHIFVIKNSGFVAYAIEGTYDVLSIVDQTHLPTVIKDKLTSVILGWTHEVKMKSRVSGREEKEYVVATLYVSFIVTVSHLISLQ